MWGSDWRGASGRGRGARARGVGAPPFGAGRFSASDPARKCGSACGEIVGAAISRRLRWRRRWRPGIMRVRLAPCGRAGRLLPCKAALSRRKRGAFSPDSIAWCRRLAEGAACSACRRGLLVLPWAWRLSPAFFGCGRRAGCASVGGGASASASCGRFASFRANVNGRLRGDSHILLRFSPGHFRLGDIGVGALAQPF